MSAFPTTAFTQEGTMMRPSQATAQRSMRPRGGGKNTTRSARHLPDSMEIGEWAPHSGAIRGYLAAGFSRTVCWRACCIPSRAGILAPETDAPALSWAGGSDVAKLRQLLWALWAGTLVALRAIRASVLVPLRALRAGARKILRSARAWILFILLVIAALVAY